MKKGVLYTILGVLAAVVAFIYYYVTLPAINIHSSGFWFFIMAAIVVVIVLYVIRKAGKDMDGDSAAADTGCIYYRKHIVVTHHKCKEIPAAAGAGKQEFYR